MKYIKTYEAKDNQTLKPVEDSEIGDYVICSDGNLNIQYFIENNIGQVAGKENNYLYVKYEDIPIDILNSYPRAFTNSKRTMYLEEIKYCSSSKNILQQIINQNKYNL
jgi:hypothetical protein